MAGREDRMTAASRPRRRASRKARVRGRGIRLRGRDVDILLALAKMRLLRTTDIARLFFGAGGTTQKRLRKLFDAGLVRTVVTDLAKENRYALTRFGHAFLVEARDDQDVPPFRAAPHIDGRSVAHLDFLNQYRIALALGAARHGLELRTFLPEWELRSRDPHAKPVPDALATLVGDQGAWQLAVEIDTGSQAPRIVERKVEHYQEAVTNGGIFGSRSPLVLIVTAKQRRARTLARAVQRKGVTSVRVALGVSPEVLEDGGLTTGLALVTDFTTSGSSAEGSVFRRGMLSVRI